MRRDIGPCVRWNGHIKKKDGYGRIGNRVAHRVLWERKYGPLPKDMELDHICHTLDPNCTGRPACPHRACVNLAHLEPVTRRVNCLRSRSFAATNAAKDRCVNGHPFDASNTYVRPDRRQRGCRACNRLSVAAYQRRRREGGAP